MRPHPFLRLLATLAAIALLATACVSGADESLHGVSADSAPPPTTTAATGTPGAETTDDGGRVTPGSDDLGSGGVEPVVFVSGDRDIVYTADLTVAVSDVAAAGTEATRTIQRLGGYLFGQETVGSPRPRSVLTFKVLPEDFQDALDRLGSIGELRSQTVSAEDVTERIVDLESRITTAEASVERLRTFLEGATTVDQVAALERELLERETELETLRGRLRTVQDQVALATIVLTLTEAERNPQMEVAVTAYPGHDDGLSCPGAVGLEVDTDADVTVCWEITNVGDTLLRDFELRDPVLDVETPDLLVVFGDPAVSIEPGESIVLAAEVTVQRSVRTRTTVTATPVDDEGTVLTSRPEADTSTMQIRAVDPGGIPGFTEGLSASWDLLVRAGQATVLAAGWIIPFLWIPLLLGWLLWRRTRRSRPDRPSAAEDVGDV